MNTLNTAADALEGVADSGQADNTAASRAGMERLDRALAHVENVVILASYSTLILVVGVETIRRALTQQQAVWGPEVALYAFIWLSWFSMAKHGRYGTHLAFSEIRRKLPDLGQRALEALDCLLWLALGTVIIATSYGVVKNNIEMGQVVFGTSIPLAAASLAVPVGWGFSMLRILQRLWLVLFSWNDLKNDGASEFVL